MKKDQSLRNEKRADPEKSFSAAIEQMAKLLRSQVKLKERMTKVLTSSPLSVSFKNSFEQIAKLIRTEIHSVRPFKKRSWKRHPSKGKKTS